LRLDAGVRILGRVNRLVVNCGGARAALAQLPAALADGLRTTAAHSTLIVGDSNSTAIHADGTSSRVAEVELARQENEVSSRIEASHDGYARRFGFLHRRQLVLAGDGHELRGEDMLLPASKRRMPAATPFVIASISARASRSRPPPTGWRRCCGCPAGACGSSVAAAARSRVEDSLWIDGEGRPQPTHQLVVSGESPAGGASVSWALKRAT